MSSADRPVEIISRSEFLETSTFPVEIVECKTANGKTIKLFCKYLGGMGPNNYGHRGGIEYEIESYEKLLKDIPLSTIKYYGNCILPENKETLMVIEYLGDLMRMNYSPDPNGIDYAAEWIARFHHFYEGKAPDYLTVYDQAYYRIWSKQFMEVTQSSHSKFNWLIPLAAYYEEHIPFLLQAPQTVIHGEFYPKNILMKDKTIYPIDWESPAQAIGEIDLASLCMGYDYEEVRKPKEIYKKFRWPDGNFSESDFEKRFLLTEIYFQFWKKQQGKHIGVDFENSEIHEDLFKIAKRAGFVN